MRHPRLRLAAVTLLALTTLGALLAARPPLSTAMWSRGDDLTVVVAWVVAIAASAWLFVVSAGCAIALGCSRPNVARRLAPALPAGVRKLVEVAIVGSCLAFPALPAASAAPARVATVVDDQPVVRAPASPAPAPVTPTAPTAPTRVIVRPGDNLWLIARTALARTTGAQPSEADIARYWHAVISANRSTLRSGNPSLVFPGEIVALPTPTGVS